MYVRVLARMRASTHTRTRTLPFSFYSSLTHNELTCLMCPTPDSREARCRAEVLRHSLSEGEEKLLLGWLEQTHSLH